MKSSPLPLLVVCTFFLSTSALAQDGAKCAAISNEKERLECYDLAFKKVSTVSSKSKWTVEEERSKIDDTVNVFAKLEANEKIRGKFGRDVTASLFVSCREGKTAAFFVMGGHFLTSIQSYGQILYRLDKRPAKKLTGKESTDHEALGFWSAPASVSFIREIAGAEIMYVQITPFNQSPVSAEFQVAGLKDAAAPLAKACKWSFDPPPAKPKPAAPKDIAPLR